MNQQCDDLSRSANEPALAAIKDMWDAEFLHTFTGPCGQQLFFDRGEEGCFLHIFLQCGFFQCKGKPPMQHNNIMQHHLLHLLKLARGSSLQT
jgi:hypothetical protein